MAEICCLVENSAQQVKTYKLQKYRFWLLWMNYLPIGPPGQLGQEQAGSEQPQNLIWTLAGMDTEAQLLLLVGGAAVVEGVGGGGGVVVVVVGGCKINKSMLISNIFKICKALPFHRRIVQPGA